MHRAVRDRFILSRRLAPLGLMEEFSSRQSSTRTGLRLRPAPAVLSCVEAELTILLSLETGRYHLLNRIGGRIWSRLSRSGYVYPDDLDDAPNCEIPAPEDIDALIFDLQKRGLVKQEDVNRMRVPTGSLTSSSDRTSAATEPAVSGPAPSLLLCLTVLAATHILLRLFGLRRVLRRLYALPKDARRAASTTLRQPSSAFSEATRCCERARSIVPPR